MAWYDAGEGQWPLVGGAREDADVISKLAADISDDRARDSSELAHLLPGHDGDLCRCQ